MNSCPVVFAGKSLGLNRTKTIPVMCVCVSMFQRKSILLTFSKNAFQDMDMGQYPGTILLTRK